MRERAAGLTEFGALETLEGKFWRGRKRCAVSAQICANRLGELKLEHQIDLYIKKNI